VNLADSSFTKNKHENLSCDAEIDEEPIHQRMLMSSRLFEN
jgi:hypothetical protein